MTDPADPPTTASLAPPPPRVDAVSGTADAASPSGKARLRAAAALAWGTLAVSVLALVVGVYGWQRLDRIQEQLAKRAAGVAEDATSARLAAEQAQTLTQTLQARLAVAEVKLSEVSLQRTQLEELMLSVSRSRDDTLVLDIDSGLRLASQQAELTGSVQPLVSALVAADRRIAKAAQPRLNPVQRAIARDLERIRSVAVTDVPALAQRLDDLVRLADELQPMNASPRARASTVTPVARFDTSEPGSKADAPAPDAPSVADTAASAGWLGQGWARVSAWGQVWWNRALRTVAASLGDLVRVGRSDRPEAVLLAPEQSFFLRENLKLKVLNARLGLLSRQVSTTRSDLVAVRHMLNTYFDPQDPATRQALQVVSDVLQASKWVVVPRPDEALSALATAAGGR
jgi:uroporphyrin-III C-methyltransferase